MRRIAVINQKGGVGKTTTTANLGAALAEQGRRVVLVDMDAQANLSLSLGVEAPSGTHTSYTVLLGESSFVEALQPTAVPNVSLLPSNLDLSGAEMELASQIGREYLLRDALKTWEDDYRKAHGRAPADYVLFDCPPSLGLLAINALAASGEVLITLQTEFLALQGMSKLVEVVQLLRKRLNPELVITGILPCLYESRVRLAREVLGEIRKYFPGQVFPVPIRSNVKLAEAPSFGQTIFQYAPDSIGATDYRCAARDVLRMEARDPDLTGLPPFRAEVLARTNHAELALDAARPVRATKKSAGPETAKSDAASVEAVSAPTQPVRPEATQNAIAPAERAPASAPKASPKRAAPQRNVPEVERTAPKVVAPDPAQPDAKTAASASEASKTVARAAEPRALAPITTPSARATTTQGHTGESAATSTNAGAVDAAKPVVRPATARESTTAATNPPSRSTSPSEPIVAPPRANVSPSVGSDRASQQEPAPSATKPASAALERKARKALLDREAPHAKPIAAPATTHTNVERDTLVPAPRGGPDAVATPGTNRRTPPAKTNAAPSRSTDDATSPKPASLAKEPQTPAPSALAPSTDRDAPTKGTEAPSRAQSTTPATATGARSTKTKPGARTKPTDVERAALASPTTGAPAAPQASADASPATVKRTKRGSTPAAEPEKAPATTTQRSIAPAKPATSTRSTPNASGSARTTPSPESNAPAKPATPRNSSRSAAAESDSAKTTRARAGSPVAARESAARAEEAQRILRADDLPPLPPDAFEILSHFDLDS